MAAQLNANLVKNGFLPAKQTVFLLCDMQERFRSGIIHFEEILQSSVRLVKLSNILGIPLIVTEQNPAALGPTVAEIDKNHAVGTFPKTKFSMCIPEVVNQLEGIKGLSSVVLFGIEAHACIEQTAVELRARNLTVHVVGDAVSSRSIEDRILAFQSNYLFNVFFGDDIVGPQDDLPQHDLRQMPLNNQPVNIGTVFSPSHFYLMRRYDFQCIKQLQDQLGTFYRKNSDLFEWLYPNAAVVPGVVCAAIYKDLGWHRIRIARVISKETVEAFSVDHGKYWILKKTELRRLPKRFAKLSEQAFRAKLAYVKPIRAAWTTGARSFFRELAKEGTAIASLLHVNEESDVITVSLTIRERSREIDIAATLVTEEYVRAVGDDPLAEMECFDDHFVVPGIDIPQHGLMRVRGKLRVHFGDIVTPSHFYLLPWIDAADLIELQDQLRTFYRNNLDVDALVYPSSAVVPGAVCAATYKDVGWRRMRIVRIISTESVEVFSVDFGNYWILKRTELRRLPMRFADLREQAFRAKLAFVEPLEGAWSTEAKTFFCELAKNKNVRALLLDEKTDFIAVELTFQKDGKEINMAARLVMEGYVRVVDNIEDPRLEMGSQNLKLEPAEDDAYSDEPLFEDIKELVRPPASPSGVGANELAASWDAAGSGIIVENMDKLRLTASTTTQLSSINSPPANYYGDPMGLRPPPEIGLASPVCHPLRLQDYYGSLPCLRPPLQPILPQPPYMPSNYPQLPHPQSSFPQLSHPQSSYPQLPHPQSNFPQLSHPQSSYPQLLHPQYSYPQLPHPQSDWPQQPYLPSYYLQHPYPPPNLAHNNLAFLHSQQSCHSYSPAPYLPLPAYNSCVPPWYAPTAPTLPLGLAALNPQPLAPNCAPQESGYTQTMSGILS